MCSFLMKIMMYETRLIFLMMMMMMFFFFFFQAEDGIRDRDVTGVQTCALRSATSLTVTSLSLGVITLLTKPSRLVSNLRSRLVTIPTVMPLSTTGTPEILLNFVISKTSLMVMSGLTVRSEEVV